jgi:hypothetical protein
MDVSQPNNATRPRDVARRFGIRVRAPERDFFSDLVGREWETFHWFATAEERDRVMQDMAARHRYSRIGDTPTLILEPVER